MCGLASGLVWILGVGAAASASAPQLRWEAPAECPSAAEVSRRLEVLLGEGTFAGSAHARVRGGGTSWSLDLAIRWREHEEERRLEATSCDGLADAAVLLLALLAENEAETGEPGAAAEVDQPPVGGAEAKAEVDVGPSEGPTEGPAEASEARPEVAEDGPRPGPEVEVEALPPESSDPLEGGAEALRGGEVRRRPRAKGVALQVGGALDYGSLAGVAGGIGLGVVALTERFRLVLGGRYLPPRRTGSTASYARNGRIDAGYGRLGACVRLGRGRIEAPICAVAEIGALRAAEFGVDGDRGALDLWAAIAAGPSLMVEVTPQIVLYADLEVAAPLARSRYVFADDVLYETARVPLRAGLGIEFRIPNQIRRSPENTPLSGDRDRIP